MPRSREVSDRQARLALAELARRGKEAGKVDFAKLSFGPQRRFIEDDSRFVSAVCGRRSGKTDGMALKALRTASTHPRAMVLYITLSRPAAKRIMWPKLLFWDRELDLGAKFNHADLTMTLRNGAQIILGGANDEAEIERYRGIATPLVILDEAQAFRTFLGDLVTDILMPATLDYDGQIALIGTPNPHCTGYFHDATTGHLVDDDGNPMFSSHHWTPFENPFLLADFRKNPSSMAPEEALDAVHSLVHRMRRDAGLKESDPRYRREWLGEWIRDTEGLVYDIPDYAIIDEFDPDEADWRYVLGIDVGYVDATAFVTLAYSTEAGRAVVVESHQETEMIPARIAAEVDLLSSAYDFDAIVIDPGGGGKFIVEELKQRYGVPAQTAEKRGKAEFIELLNGDLRANALQIVRHSNRELIQDAALLQWDYTLADKRPTKTRSGRVVYAKDKLRIDDRTPDHLLDAMLYGYRECHQWLNDGEAEGPAPGTPEWIRMEEDEMLQAAERKVQGRDEPWWMSIPESVL